MKVEYGHYSGSLMTGQEHLFIGSTPDHEAYENPYKPLLLLQRHYDSELIKVVDDARRIIKIVSSGLAGFIIGIPHSLAFSLEPLDLKIGDTTQDPRVLGIWDDEKKIVIPVENRDINQEYRQALMKYQEDSPSLHNYFLR